MRKSAALQMVRERTSLTVDGVLAKVDELERNGTLRVVERKKYFPIWLMDWVTGGKYGQYVTTIRMPWERVVTIAMPTGWDRRRAWKILCHELVHYYQWKSEFGDMGMIRRYLSDAGRLEIEAPAYAVTIEIGGWSAPHIVSALHSMYFIDELCEGKTPSCDNDNQILLAINRHLDDLRSAVS